MEHIGVILGSPVSGMVIGGAGFFGQGGFPDKIFLKLPPEGGMILFGIGGGVADHDAAVLPALDEQIIQLPGKELLQRQKAAAALPVGDVHQGETAGALIPVNDDPAAVCGLDHIAGLQRDAGIG